MNAAWLGLAVNLALGAVKLAGGVAGNAFALISDAVNSLGDSLTSAVVRWGGPAFLWADEAAALVVAAAIIWSAAGLFRNSASELLDVQADDELLQQIRREAAAVEGVQAVEKLWVRKTGLEYLADIHIEVDARMTVEEGHRIGHLVKDRLVARFAGLRDVLVHLEPHPHEHGH